MYGLLAAARKRPLGLKARADVPPISVVARFSVVSQTLMEVPVSAAAIRVPSGLNATHVTTWASNLKSVLISGVTAVPRDFDF